MEINMDQYSTIFCFDSQIPGDSFGMSCLICDPRYDRARNCNFLFF